MNDLMIDMFLTGMIGGVIGATLLVYALYFHFKSLYIQYDSARSEVIDIVCMKKLEKDIEILKHQFEVIQRETYEQFSDEDYK